MAISPDPDPRTTAIHELAYHIAEVIKMTAPDMPWPDIRLALDHVVHQNLIAAHDGAPEPEPPPEIEETKGKAEQKDPHSLQRAQYHGQR